MPDDTALIREAASSVADAALHGLLKTPKTLPARLFYDEKGCRLFQQITELPEYYLTRTERSLLEQVAPEVASLTIPGTNLVEYGASDETKAETLLRQRRDHAVIFSAYTPIDIAADGLVDIRMRLSR